MTMMHSVYAISATPPTGSFDTTTFDQILQPVWKVYNFVRYIATAIACLMLVYAGITYMSSGNDMGQRETAKQIITYVVLGLIVIWATPYIVQLLAV